MKKLNYTVPEASIVSITTADVITASAAAVGLDGVIELAAYGFDGGDVGGGF